MPTKPLESILYRELSQVEGKDIINIASPLLEELVNYGTCALARSASSAPGGVYEHVAVHALYRHVIEMTDGIEALVSQACPAPAVPLVRSCFEAWLSMEYLLEKDYERRSLCWLVGYIHQRLDMCERFDLSTAKGARFKEVFDNDRIVSRMSWPSVEAPSKARENLLSLLAKPVLRPIESEFARQKRQKWYRLFDGPSSLFELAQYLNLGACYDVLYRGWSRVAHGQDLLSFLVLDRTVESEQAIARLREPLQIQNVAIYASAFMLNATRLILGKFRSGEDLSRWYKREVLERNHLLREWMNP